jgi:hypothetical protein
MPFPVVIVRLDRPHPICQTRSVTEDGIALAAAEATTASLRAAGEGRDAAAFLQPLSSDVKLRSPISFKAKFEGIDEVAPVVHAIFDVIHDIEYFDDLGTSTTRALFYRARIGDEALEGATLVRLDESAKVVEFTFFVRPLPGLAALTAQLGPRLGAQYSRMRALVVAALTRPIAAVTRAGDGLGVRLVQPRRR